MKNICWIVLSIFMTMSCSKKDFQQDITIYAPNSFSPNGDGINDTFKVVVSDSALVKKSEHRFNIYTTSGLKVFESHKIYEAWNGTFSGKKMYGTFVWEIQLIFKDGSENYNYQGTVSITN